MDSFHIANSSLQLQGHVIHLRTISLSLLFLHFPFHLLHMATVHQLSHLFFADYTEHVTDALQLKSIIVFYFNFQLREMNWLAKTDTKLVCKNITGKDLHIQCRLTWATQRRLHT